MYNNVYYRILANMLSMARKFLMAIPGGIIAGIIAWIILGQYQIKKGKNISKQKSVAIILFSTYCVLMIQLTITSRTFGSGYMIDLVPFNTPGGTKFIVLYALANVIAFLPVGILTPMIWDKINDMKLVLLVGFCGSLFIEVVQLVLQRGVCQTEDLLMNTVGAGIGYLLYRRGKRLRQRRR